MARIQFRPDQQQTLSGTLCGFVYRTRGGKVSMLHQPEPVLPKRPTEAQWLKYRKDCVVQDCVCRIQSLILDRTDRSVAEMQRVADMHHLIKTAMQRWYDYYRPYFKDDGKLVKAIVYYFESKKYPPQFAFDKQCLQMSPCDIERTVVSAPPTECTALALLALVGDPSKDGHNLDKLST